MRSGLGDRIENYWSQPLLLPMFVVLAAPDAANVFALGSSLPVLLVLLFIMLMLLVVVLLYNVA